MNVIQVTSDPVGGGAQLLVRELNSRLIAYGVRSKAVYLSNKHDAMLNDGEYCFDLRHPRSFGAANKLRRFFREHAERETVIHGHLTDALFILVLPGVSSGLLKMFTEHDTFNKRRELPGFRAVERCVYARYDKISCISRATSEALLEWLGHDKFVGRTEIVNNGARLFDMAPRPAAFEKVGLTLISVGSLIKKKGFDLAIEALARAKCPISRYIVVGEGTEQQNLERQAAALGVSHLVDFLGWRDDIEPLLHLADLQLIPSRWEGFGLVAVEGLSTGLRVVAANVPGLDEVLRDSPAAQLVKPESPDALARGIEAVWKHRNQAASLAIEARERAETFSLDTMVEKYSRIYSEILERRVR